MHRTTVRRAIIIGNGFAGAENQCYGLIRALGLSHHHSFYVCMYASYYFISLFDVCSYCLFDQRVRRPKLWLPVSTPKTLLLHRFKKQVFHPQPILPADQSDDILEADAQAIATDIRETFHKDGPVLVVASGRDTISVATSIKRFAPDHVFTIQIQHPRSHLSRFDMVITPQHDYYPHTLEGKKQTPWFLRGWITPRQPPRKNVVLTLGALHQVDSDALQCAASAWHDELASLCKPLLVVNIGGPIRHCKYGADLARQLTASLMNVLPTCGSIRISFSRRTPKQVSDILVKEFHNHPKVYIWDGQDPNPHMGHLAWADAFVITADSVSMLSEACSMGKPVYVIGAERCTWKFAYFHKCLQERGMARPFTGDENIAKSWTYPPLQDTAEAAEHVIQALAKRGWNLQP
ncbi:mitochondrial fission protein ELM1-like isoform X3 [Bidens hawaiensis]|uniref:mitochondrial fission protein ELM1-like isoform X3 n=1 Tax=Bidens hawaiensis TaxID=980011 RepID=UPI004049B2BE